MSNFIKLDLPKFEGILECVNTLVENSKLQWNSEQICVNSTVDHLDDTCYGVGSLVKNWSNTRIEDGCIVGVENLSRKCKELDFTELCKVFKGTVIEDVYTMLISKFIVGRVRLIKINPLRCMSWHKDVDRRLHYPLSTNTSCRMVIDNECIHIPEFSWWITDTTKFHTAFNGSLVPRIHLVASIISEK
jgi:hypothetical protein